MQRLLITLCLGLTIYACRPNNKTDLESIAGYVIAQDTCYHDESKNAWLLDCTVRRQTPQLGDTLVIGNVQYTNVIRIRNLKPDFQFIGLAVSVYYSEISEKKISTGCDVTSPSGYALREVVAKMQGFAE